MIIILTFIFVLVDLISKIVISKIISYGNYVWIFKYFLSFTYVKNTGVAWSLFDDKPIFVLLISLFIIAGIILYLRKSKPKNKFEIVSYALILGGAIGNFIDRLINGYVTDFISVIIFNYEYPIFNLADCFVVIGVILLVIYTWIGDKNGDSSRRK